MVLMWGGSWYGKKVFDHLVAKPGAGAVEKLFEGFYDRTLGQDAPRPLHRRVDLIYDLFLNLRTNVDFIPPEHWQYAPPDVDIGGGVVEAGLRIG